MDAIKYAKYAGLFYSIVFIGIGICLIIFPGWSVSLICRCIGAAAAVCGVIRMISYFVHDTYGLAFQFDLALGAFTFLIGGFLLVFPLEFAAALCGVVGMFVLVDGVFKLQTAVEAKRFGLHGWWGILLLAVLTVAAGFFILCNPFDSVAWLVSFLGIALILEGIQNLCVAAYTVKLIKRFYPIGKEDDEME